MSRAPRRVRCTGPLCAAKRPAQQLHPRSEMVQLPGGRRYCLECVDAATQQPAEAGATVAGELWVAGAAEGFTPAVRPVEVEIPPAAGQDSVADGGQAAPAPAVLPAPAIQVDLGDPLAYTRFPDVKVEGWPLRKGRLSASSIGTFITCPEKFRQREIMGMREPGSGASIAGGAAHKGVEAYYRHVMMQGTPPPPRVWQEWLHAKFDDSVEREAGPVDWGKQAGGDRHPLTPDEVRARAEQVAATYIERIAPHVNPVGVEEPFVTWVEGCPVPVVGSKDIITPDTVIDVKFGKAQAQIDPGWRIQGLIYLLDGERDMEWHSVGWPKVDGSCTFHTPLDAPSLRLPRTYENYSIASDVIRSSVKSILAYTAAFGVDAPWPGNLSHQWACDLCLFKRDGSCSWWHRNIRAEDLL